MSDFKAKMHQIRFRLGLRPRPGPLGKLQRSPDPLVGFKGPLRRREGKGKGWEGEGEGDGEGGEEEERRERREREGMKQGRGKVTEGMEGTGQGNGMGREGMDPKVNGGRGWKGRKGATAPPPEKKLHFLAPSLLRPQFWPRRQCGRDLIAYSAELA